MTKVFIGGSRRISRLSKEVKERLDNIVERQLSVILGDANGVDKAVQQHFHGRHYRNVEVYCVAGTCRNNVGRWELKVVNPASNQKGLDYFTAKDRVMATAADLGFMIWDGKSTGTLLNVLRLVGQAKKVVVYSAASKDFVEVRTERDLSALLSVCPLDARRKVEKQLQVEKSQDVQTRQTALL